jgi:hypothetical protein
LEIDAALYGLRPVEGRADRGADFRTESTAKEIKCDES